MAKVSVRALRRQLKQERAQHAALAEQFFKLDAERDDKLDYFNSRCADLNRSRDDQRNMIAKLQGDLLKEQRFSELVVNCLHGILAMTKAVADQPSTGMMVADGERR